ncbi:hypothetical protein QIA04_04990 (plasmid) [Borreliella burgdorferi]|nr:hypothetical protein BHT49_07290 [Borreliella burgdorferi]QYM88011.1 hypothetical protein KGA77_04875 [Borreliella burgdorferi]
MSIEERNASIDIIKKYIQNKNKPIY